MKHFLLILIISIVSVTILSSQSYQEYVWGNDIFSTAEYDDDGYSVEVLKSHIQEEYVIDSELGFVVFGTKHKAIYVQNDNAVEKSNRIYIPVNSQSALVAIGARTILPDGSTVTFDESNLKEIKGEEENQSYKIFAMEGVEVGSVIDYYYTVVAPGRYFDREFLTEDYPVYNFSYKMMGPSQLTFDHKLYNLDADIQEIVDTVLDIKTYAFELDKIEPIEEETMADYTNSRARIDMKLLYASPDEEQLNTWYHLAERIFESINIGEEERQLCVTYLDGLDIFKKDMSQRDSIAVLEFHIKSSIYLNENAPAQADSVAFIINNSFGSERGLTRFYHGLLSVLGASPQIGLLSPRGKAKIDPEFQSYSSIDEYILYLPGVDDYIAPYSYESRMGLLPAEYTELDVFFVTPLEFRDMVTYVPEFKWIKAYSSDLSEDDMYISVKFDEDLLENIVTTKRVMNGHNASFLKAIIPQIEPDQFEELEKNIIQQQAAEADIQSKELTPSSFDYSNWAKPIEVTGTFTTEEYIEDAGDVILFSVGELIGEQSEMYQDKVRKTDVMNDFNRSYYREIVIDIPEDYIVENAEDIDMDFQVSDNGKHVFVFKSSHKIENGKLFITIDEFYDQIHFPKARFEEFRSVINAAADWNKVVLVFREE